MASGDHFPLPKKVRAHGDNDVDWDDIDVSLTKKLMAVKAMIDKYILLKLIINKHKESNKIM